MTKRSGLGWPAWVLTLWLLIAAGAGASPWPGAHPAPDSPPSPYSPWHYWTPTLYRLHVRFHGWKGDMSKAAYYPQIAPGSQVIPAPGTIEPAAAVRVIGHAKMSVRDSAVP